MADEPLTSLEPAAAFTAVDGRRFAFPVGAAFGLLAALASSQGSIGVALVLAAPCALLWTLGALVPARLGPLLRAWMALAHAISKVTTPIFLAVLWLVVITPFALVGRLVGHRPVEHEPRGDSYWQARPLERRRSALERQF